MSAHLSWSWFGTLYCAPLQGLSFDSLWFQFMCTSLDYPKKKKNCPTFLITNYIFNLSLFLIWRQLLITRKNLWYMWWWNRYLESTRHDNNWKIKVWQSLLQGELVLHQYIINFKISLIGAHIGIISWYTLCIKNHIFYSLILL